MRNQLSIVSTTFLVVASMLGTGILTTTGIILALVKAPGAVVVVWIVGGILAWFGAYCYGIIARSLPKNGGEAVILREYFSPVLGEIAGWTSFVVGFAASNAATSLALSAYLEAAFPDLPIRSELVACGALLMVTVLHGVFGATGMRVQTALAATKFSLLAGLVLYGLFLVGPSSSAQAAAQTGAPASFGADWGVAMMLVMFAYSGWNAAIYVVSEVKNTGRTVANSMLIGTSIIMLLYVGVNLTVLRQLAPAEIEGVIPIIASLVKSLFGAGASEVFSALVAFALLSSLGASAFLGPRVLAAMLAWLGDRADRPAAAAVHVSPRLIWLQAAVSIAMVLTGTFEQILTIMGFLLGFFPIVSVLSIYRIVPTAEAPVPAVARYFLAPLFIAVMSGILMLGAWQRPVEVSVAVALVLAFFLLRQGMRRLT
jgi:APA family basic amino acid/polyamine antiporter